MAVNPSIPDSPDLTFGVFADPQYCDCQPDTELNRYFRKAAEKLKRCISHLKSCLTIP
ncbi:MAG: hypothetical protein ACOC1D_00320 [Prolixibacteraceae bacterium]